MFGRGNADSACGRLENCSSKETDLEGFYGNICRGSRRSNSFYVQTEIEDLLVGSRRRGIEDLAKKIVKYFFVNILKKRI